MAINIDQTYSPRSNPPSAEYVTGSVKDKTDPFSNDGTPLTAILLNDIVGFTDALLAEANITRNDLSDTALNSDRLKAVLSLIARQTDLIPINTGGQATVNRRYVITDDSTITLPDVTGLTDKDSVYFVRHAGASNPSIQVDGSNGEMIDFFKPSTALLAATDSVVSYNVNYSLIFKFNATSGNWEL